MTELLAPVGSEAALDAALRFGADAVYLGGSMLQLRAKSAGFSDEALHLAAQRVHRAGKRLYVTVNALATCDEISLMGDYANRLYALGADAAIVSDLGVLVTMHRACPALSLHVSTQASCQNQAAATEYHALGASRVVLARELSIDEIKKLRANTPPELELEAFVHGAMCMSYSGRCILSSALLGRSGNRGDCAQPCRWSYHLVEETRPNQYFPIIEEDGHTMLLSSRDLNCIDLLDELKDAGVSSFKIEGRMKTEYYVAVTVNAYRHALDGTMPLDACRRELNTISHRPYTTGFYHWELPRDHHNAGIYIQDYTFVGTVLDAHDGMITVCQRNRFSVGDTLEIVSPHWNEKSFSVLSISDENGEAIEVANRVKQIVQLPCPLPLEAGDLLRRKND